MIVLFSLRYLFQTQKKLKKEVYNLSRCWQKNRIKHLRENKRIDANMPLGSICCSQTKGNTSKVFWVRKRSFFFLACSFFCFVWDLFFKAKTRLLKKRSFLKSSKLEVFFSLCEKGHNLTWSSKDEKNFLFSNIMLWSKQKQKKKPEKQGANIHAACIWY
jgi:hypothetical protein